MTALELLGLISAVLLVQIVAAITYVVLRPKPAPPEAVPVRAAPNAAWQGLRAFRVRMREGEDDALTQTSFYLEPVDGQPLPPYRGGQFLTFQLDLPDAAGSVRPVTRCYSLSDRPDRQAYRSASRPRPTSPICPRGSFRITYMNTLSRARSFRCVRLLGPLCWPTMPPSRPS